MNAVLHIARDRLGSLARRHPWVFSGAIRKIEGSPEAGDLVELVGPRGEVLGYGHYATGSIAVRMLRFGPKAPDRTWWQETLNGALELRRRLGLVDREDREARGAFRWVHGEGDGLPGLILDVYANTAVIHAHDLGMHHQRQLLAEILAELLPDRIDAVYYRRKDPEADKRADLGEYLLERKAPITSIVDNGVELEVDWVRGQKTGLFLDQREHRRQVGALAKGHRVLNLFSYNGGFSLAALAGGAERVVSVDASEPAMRSLESNLARLATGADLHTGLTQDVF